MKIKYSPILNTEKTTQIVKNSETSITIDGQLFQFATEDGDYPNILEESNNKILKAEIIDGELRLEVNFNYQLKDRVIWENTDYYYVGSSFRGTEWEDL